MQKTIIKKPNKNKDLKEIVKIDDKYFTQNTLFVGNRKTLEENIETQSKNFFENFPNNKKVLFYKISELEVKIDQIRDLKTFANQTFDGVKIILISSFSWNVFTQNAMLKILEDTPKDTFIYLIAQNKSNILPTIFSRVFLCKILNTNIYAEMVKEILNLPIEERLENKHVKKILNSKIKSDNFDEDDDKVRKDLEVFLEFFEAIYSCLASIFREGELEKKVGKQKAFEILNKLQEVDGMIKTQGMQPNYLVEYLMLYLPKI